ncbi:MAG: hypothetical protein K0R93_3613 [Anaerosolibacter sp.]|jgi:putative nucleotidyltransferase with HDIG domain|uniref:HD domain-containing phosphohydrolase n=1 Tax=Anaerosolibacter sp. TaxID=1872527 RepID=UPI002614AF29|nr:HD domain-containing phosphohydrolase [Anaerosolibacter sp.]MDF2548715.1 hypothetical protein [Anaerosolibacter sp.]
MRLTHKYLIGTLLCILISALLTLMGIILPLYRTETTTLDYTVNNRIRTMDVFFERNIQTLSDKAIEYAYWDDLIMALENENIPWIRDNITEYLFHSPFNIDLVYLTSDSYDYHEFYGDESLSNQLPVTDLFQTARRTSEPASSFVLFDKQLYIVTISPITNNDGSLSSKGFLVLGRTVDDEVLYPLVDYIGDEAVIQLKPSHLIQGPHHTIKDHRHISFNYPVRDFKGRIIAFHGVTMDVSYFMNLKYLLFRNISLIVILSLIICSYIVYHVIRKLTFQFEQSVNAIENIANGKYEQKMDEQGSYELQILAKSINKLSTNIHQKTFQMRENYLRTIETLSTALEVKDPYTMGHSDRVSKYSMAIASALSLKDIDHIETAALMHDIGKIGIPEYILNKNGRLTPEEFQIVREHPEKGYRILDIIEDFHEIKYMIRYHHEWYNGNGYPQGLSGESIPIGARIIAIADAFDAMTSHRPYRLALPIEQAIDEINKMAGSQFDPAIVAVFNSVVYDMIKMPAAPSNSASEN